MKVGARGRRELVAAFSALVCAACQYSGRVWRAAAWAPDLLRPKDRSEPLDPRLFGRKSAQHALGRQPSRKIIPVDEVEVVLAEIGQWICSRRAHLRKNNFTMTDGREDFCVDFLLCDADAWRVAAVHSGLPTGPCYK